MEAFVNPFLRSLSRRERAGGVGKRGAKALVYGNSEKKDQRFSYLDLTTYGEGAGDRGSAAREADGKGRRVERRPGCEGLPPRAAGEERGTEKANGGPPGGCGGAVMPRDGRAPAPSGAFGSRAQTEIPQERGTSDAGRRDAAGSGGDPPRRGTPPKCPVTLRGLCLYSIIGTEFPQ